MNLSLKIAKVLLARAFGICFLVITFAAPVAIVVMGLNRYSSRVAQWRADCLYVGLAPEACDYLAKEVARQERTGKAASSDANKIASDVLRAGDGDRHSLELENISFVQAFGLFVGMMMAGLMILKFAVSLVNSVWKKQTGTRLIEAVAWLTNAAVGRLAIRDAEMRARRIADTPKPGATKEDRARSLAAKVLAEAWTGQKLPSIKEIVANGEEVRHA